MLRLLHSPFVSLFSAGSRLTSKLRGIVGEAKGEAYEQLHYLCGLANNAFNRTLQRQQCALSAFRKSRSPLCLVQVRNEAASSPESPEFRAIPILPLDPQIYPTHINSVVLCTIYICTRGNHSIRRFGSLRPSAKSQEYHLLSYGTVV